MLVSMLILMMATAIRKHRAASDMNDEESLARMYSVLCICIINFVWEISFTRYEVE